MNIKSLIVIGNGFDIAHGIQSRYSDFHKYLTEHKSMETLYPKSFLPVYHDIFEEDIKKYILLNKLEKYIPHKDLWSSFEKSLGYLNYEKLKKNYFCYLNEYKNNKENYYDKGNYYDKKYNIKKVYENHDFQYIIQRELDFTDDIDEQFQKWINGLNTKAASLPSILKILKECPAPVLFLNFNYTDTLTGQLKVFV